MLGYSKRLGERSSSSFWCSWFLLLFFLLKINNEGESLSPSLLLSDVEGEGVILDALVASVLVGREDFKVERELGTR